MTKKEIVFRLLSRLSVSRQTVSIIELERLVRLELIPYGKNITGESVTRYVRFLNAAFAAGESRVGCRSVRRGVFSFVRQ